MKNRTIKEKAKAIDWIAPLINHKEVEVLYSRVFKTDHHLDIQLEKSQDFKFNAFHPLKKLTCQFIETNHSRKRLYPIDILDNKKHKHFVMSATEQTAS